MRHCASRKRIYGRRKRQPAVHRALQMRSLQVGLEAEHERTLLPVVTGVATRHPTAGIGRIESGRGRRRDKNRLNVTRISLNTRQRQGGRCQANSDQK
jgi:hypothetical protein